MKRFVILLSLGAVLAVPVFVFANHNTSHSIQQLQAKIQALQAQLDALKDSTKVSSPVPSPVSPLPTVTPTTGSGSATTGVGQAVGSTFLPTPIFDDDTSDDDIVQLNHLRIQGISSPTLPTVITATYDIGVGCRKFEGLGSARSAEFPCPLAPTLLYSIRVDTDTKLLLRNRHKATLADFSVGDRINVFGFMDRDTRLIDALIVRNLDKPAVKKFIQLNNVETLSSPNAPAPPASFEVIKSHQLPCFDFGETGEGSGGSFPCPLGLEVEAQSPQTKPESLLYPQPRKYTIEVTTKTQIFNRYFEVIPLSDIKVGDKLNIYGLQYSHNSSTLEAFTIRNLSKPPKTEREKIIQVTSPSNGEKWRVGTTQKIQWKNTTGRNVRIELNSSQPGGVYFHYVIAGPLGASVNSYTWTVPDETPGANYIIRVTSLDTSGAADYKFFSYATFSIVATTSESPSITVLSPNGGEKLIAGKSYETKHYIKNPPAGSKFAKLWLLEVVSSASLQQLATFDVLEYSSDYTWLWVVPASIAPSQYKILAEFYKGTPGNESLISRDESDAPFTIVAVEANLPPVISGVKGPTALKVGEIGTWTISASDPENGPLSYSVIWGDEEKISISFLVPPSITPVQQITTFTHSYAKAGIYTPTFTVTDAQSLSAKTSISVNVIGTISVPTITILSPNGGEYWKLGSEQTIQWRSSNVPADHRIITVRLRSTVTNQEYILLNNTLNDGIERIVVPPTLTQDSYLLEIKTIVDDQTIFDQSDNYFKIIADAPYITVLSPNGGEVWKFGQNQTITWKSTAVNNAYIYLQFSDGGICKLADVSASIGNYSFTLVQNFPCGNIPRTVIAGSSYRVNIRTENEVVKDSSDAPFSIVEAIPPLTIASPNGGEVWQIGSEQRIRSNLPFQDIPLSAWFEITITKGSAGPAQNITNGFLPMSSYGFADYPWVIPTSFVPGNDYRVHLYVYSDSFGSKLLASDSSDAYFSIVAAAAPSITVISPNGGEVLEVGKTYNIKWFSNNGTLTRFTLLSGDGTTAYDIKTGNLPFESVNDGIEPWTVSNVVPGKYRLRIYCPGIDLPDQNTGNCEFRYNKFFDDSDTPFSIVSTQSFYPGFNMTLDKSTYASRDTLVLTSSRADGKVDPYPVDIYAVRSKDNAKTLIQASASIAINTKISIYLDRWGIFNEGGAGEYLILFCDASKECVGGVNTNSVPFNIVDPSVTQPVFQKISIPSTTLFTGSNIVYRFSATAGPDGEKTIKTLEFPYNASNLTFSDFKVGVYADSNFSQGIPVPSSTVKDDGKLIWNSTVVIPAGTKRYFELRLQITNQTSSSVLSIALSGQTYNTLTGSGSTAMIDTPKYELANALEAIRVELDQISKIINGLR